MEGKTITAEVEAIPDDLDIEVQLEKQLNESLVVQADETIETLKILIEE